METNHFQQMLFKELFHSILCATWHANTKQYKVYTRRLEDQQEEESPSCPPPFRWFPSDNEYMEDAPNGFHNHSDERCTKSSFGTRVKKAFHCRLKRRGSVDLVSMASIFEDGACQHAKKDICKLKQTKHDEFWIVLTMFHVMHVLIIN